MLTYYSFYKKCSGFGIALFVALAMNMAFVQASFAADADEANDVVNESVENTPIAVADTEAVLDEDGEEDAEKVEEEKDPAKRLGLKTKSTEFLANFNREAKRDPFTEMQAAPQEAMPAGDSWWDESDTAQVTEQNKDLYFNGQSPAASSAAYARLPMIKVTGMLQIGGRSAVTAIIQNKGSCVLYENDRLVLNTGKANINLTKWIFVKKIHANGMTLILDDGKEISGKFY